MSNTGEEMSSAPYLAQEEGDVAPVATSSSRQDSTAAWVNNDDAGAGKRAAPGGRAGGLDENLLDGNESEFGDGLESVIDEPIVPDNADELEPSSPQVPLPKVIPNTSIFKSAFHIFKGNVGTGVFLLPTIYNDAGYIAGPIIALCCGAMVTDATMMLLRAKKKINRDEVQSYPQVVAFVFGNVFRMIINASIVAIQFGLCMIYLQFAAGLLESIHPFAHAYKIWVIIALFLVFPLTLASNNMSLLAIASATATGCVFFCVVSTLGETGSKLSGGAATDKIEAVVTPTRWVLYVASSMSVLEGIALVLPVENACKDKDKFAPMVKIVLACIIVLYLIYGMVGYLAYGSSITVSVVNVLEINPFTIVIRVALALNLLMTYPLQYVPAIQIIDQALRIDKHRALKSSRAIVARVMTNLMMGMLAMLIGADTVGLILAFIGSIAATMLAVILPAMLELQTDYAISSQRHRSGWKYFKHMFSPPHCTFIKLRCYVYIVVGTITMVAGTITCLFDAASLGHHKGGKSVEHLRNHTASSDLLREGF